MKILSIAITSAMALSSAAFAGGIEGRVTDENGNPRRGVTISVKGYRQTTTTDSNGYYTLKMPTPADGTRVNVYVNGNFAVNSLIPVGDANSKIMVTLVRR